MVTTLFVQHFSNTPEIINQTAVGVASMAADDPERFKHLFPEPGISYSNLATPSVEGIRILDWWGRPLHMRYIATNGNVGENENAFAIIVYSVGANAVDEHGSNDDIASVPVIIALPKQ